MLEIIYKKEQPDLFKKHWEAYAEKQAVSPRYIFLTLLYYLEMMESEKTLVSDWSFVCLKAGEPSAAVFLPIEKIGSVLSISHRGGYTIAPHFTDSTSAKEIFRLIDEIARKEGVTKIMFAVDALESSRYPFNFLLKYGYLNSSLLNWLIDLILPEPLLDHCRKGHRSDIKTIYNDKDFEVFHVDSKKPDYDVHEKYRELHRLASGRATRSKASFDFQFEKLKVGQAAIFGLKYKGKIIAASYFESHGKKVLYGSACEDPEYNKMPLYHSMVFAAMEYYKKRGFSYIEVSQPFNPSAQFDYYPDKKQINIGLFKRGFGGNFVNDYRGIKYFDVELFTKDADKFKVEYQKVIGAESNE